MKKVVIGKSVQGHFLLMFIMETIKHAYAQSFISMCTIVCKFGSEEVIFKQKCPRLFFVGGCHGNQMSVIAMMYKWKNHFSEMKGM